LVHKALKDLKGRHLLDHKVLRGLRVPREDKDLHLLEQQETKELKEPKGHALLEQQEEQELKVLEVDKDLHQLEQ